MADPIDNPSSRLGDYELREPIGSGAYGTVHAAYQRSMGREVAIKIIRPEHANKTDFINRFEAEAQMVARLEHPHIVPVHDYWRDESGAYLVMRLLKGGCLNDRLARGPLSIDAVLKLAEQVGAALAAAHRSGVVHRDLKPSNILFDREGNAYLSDFGIAKNLEAEVKLTPTGAVLGTPDYISPEQIRGQALTPAADQYSLGVVLFEALTGRVPFPGLALAALFQKHLADPLPAVSTLRPGLPAELDWVLGQATAKEPARRFRDMVTLVVSFREAITQGESFRIELETGDEIEPASISQPPFLSEEREEQAAPFVGREGDLKSLEKQLALAIEGQGRVLFVTGEVGSGKTSLLQAFARRALEVHPALLVAWGACNAFSGSGDPYLPFRDVLKVLTGDLEAGWRAGSITGRQAESIWGALPQVAGALLSHGSGLLGTLLPGDSLVNRLTTAMPAGSLVLSGLQERAGRGQGVSGELEQGQLFDQVTGFLQALSDDYPLLILLDDLQWVDQASVNLLFHLGRRLLKGRVLVVGAYRPEEVSLGRDGERHPLEKVVAEFQRSYGQPTLNLQYSQEEERRAFLDALLDLEPNMLDRSFRDALLAHTGGIPLFTVEMLRYLKECGDLVQGEEGYWATGGSLSWDGLPNRVEGVIAERIDRLEEDLREILNVAAVEGELFTVQVVARVQGVQERPLLRTLARELGRRHQLVQEREARRVGRQMISGYRFSHALFQQYLYDDLTAGERQLLHAEIAGVLEELYGEKAGDIAVQLARHYLEAGDEEQALPYLLQAGESAREIFAYHEAAGHLRQAVALLEKTGDYEQAARTYMTLGLVLHNIFDFQGARQAYDRAFALWAQKDPGQMVYDGMPSQVLRVSAGEPVILDPTAIYDVFSVDIEDQLFTSLVDYDEGMNVIPAAAQRWEVSDGGRRYIFHLRPDGRWSDGRPVTAGDFVAAVERILDPASTASARDQFARIEGAEEFAAGRGKQGVRAVDTYTLEVSLGQPDPAFLYTVAGWAPVPQHLVRAYGEAWSQPEKLAGNGPFMLREWKKGQWMTLVENPEYTAGSRGNVRQIEIDFGRDLDESIDLYEAGDFDVIPLDLTSMPGSSFNQLQKRFAGEYLTTSALQTNFVHLDPTNLPFDDPRLRQAVIMALDREKLAHIDLEGLFYPGVGGFIPPGVPGHRPDIGLPYDPDQARRLMKGAGFSPGRDGPQLRAVWQGQGSGVFATIQQAIARQLSQNLGLDFSWENIPWAHGGYEADDPGRPHLWIGGWISDIPDPDYMMNAALFWRNKDARFEQLLQQAREATNLDERLRRFQAADRQLIQSAVMNPILYGRRHYLIKPWVRHYPLSPINRVPWKDAIIDSHE